MAVVDVDSLICCKGTLLWFPGKGKMAGSEPLIQEADPHIAKLESEASDGG